jgi:hypothetical protein
MNVRFRGEEFFFFFLNSLLVLTGMKTLEMVGGGVEHEISNYLEFVHRYLTIVVCVDSFEKVLHGCFVPMTVSNVLKHKFKTLY